MRAAPWQGNAIGDHRDLPWHGWQFDVTTGQHCLSPAICQVRYPVTIDGDRIVIELPDDDT